MQEEGLGHDDGAHHGDGVGEVAQLHEGQEAEQDLPVGVRQLREVDAEAQDHDHDEGDETDVQETDVGGVLDVQEEEGGAQGQDDADPVVQTEEDVEGDGRAQHLLRVRRQQRHLRHDVQKYAPGVGVVLVAKVRDVPTGLDSEVDAQ